MEGQDRGSYRARIRAETEKIQPGEVFDTPDYKNLLRILARELTGGRLDNVRLYQNPYENRMGWCDGRTIAINYGNAVLESFHTLPQKNLSLIGTLGHECGHKRYSDFALQKKYLEGMLEGIWYPHPPKAETAQEEESLEQMKGYFLQKDPDVMALLVQVAGYLDNLLEDIYVEEKMCALFPGSVRRGILLNRERNVEWIPTLRQLLEEGEDPVSILMNLCAQYTLSGRINNWDNEESVLLDTLKELMPVIQKGITGEQKSTRFLAVNRILLKIWSYLYEIIRKLEEEKKKREQDPQENGQQDGAEGNGQEGNGKDEEKDGEKGADQETENGACPNNQKGGGKQPENGGGEIPQDGSGQSVSSAMEEYLKHLAGRIPQFIQEPEGESLFYGFPEDTVWSGSWELEAEESEEPSAAAGREEQKTNHARLPDAEGKLWEILFLLASRRVDAQINAEINRRLQNEIDGMEFDKGHEKVKKQVCRMYEITDRQKWQYGFYEEKAKAAQKRLRRFLLPVFQNQGARSERRLFMGRRVDMQNIANPQGAIFKKEYPGKHLDLAMAVLIDMSESMMYGRLEQSKLAALCLYLFCQKAGIPIMVYGHHTDGYSHRRLEEETVYLHCCAEFEPDKNDCYRIAALQPHGANRDGVALRFIGEKLSRRPERHKLLVLISDGMPNSNQYRGKMAKQDLMEVKKKLTGSGIAFVAAAIGADKMQIREIYQKAFLDISDVEKIPDALVKKVVNYVRRV